MERIQPTGMYIWRVGLSRTIVQQEFRPLGSSDK
jgi:hypothetical protein